MPMGDSEKLDISLESRRPHVCAGCVSVQEDLRKAPLSKGWETYPYKAFMEICPSMS